MLLFDGPSYSEVLQQISQGVRAIWILFFCLGFVHGCWSCGQVLFSSKKKEVCRLGLVGKENQELETVVMVVKELRWLDIVVGELVVKNWSSRQPPTLLRKVWRTLRFFWTPILASLPDLLTASIQYRSAWL